MIEETPVAFTGAEILRKEAAKIELNASDFAGAMILIPPSGDATTHIFLNNTADAVFFWTQVSTIVKMALDKFEESNRPGGYR